jgi:hypothetical protein
LFRVFSGNPQTVGVFKEYLAREAQQQALQQKAGKKKGDLAVLLTHNQRIYGYLPESASPGGAGLLTHIRSMR